MALVLKIFAVIYAKLLAAIPHKKNCQSSKNGEVKVHNTDYMCENWLRNECCDLEMGANTKTMAPTWHVYLDVSGA